MLIQIASLTARLAAIKSLKTIISSQKHENTAILKQYVLELILRLYFAAFR